MNPSVQTQVSHGHAWSLQALRPDAHGSDSPISGGRRKTRFLAGGCLLLTARAFYLQLSFFAHSPLRCFLETHTHTLAHCKQRSSTVSKKARIASNRAQIVSKEAPKHNCRQKSSAGSEKPPIASKRAAFFVARTSMKFGVGVYARRILDNFVQQPFAGFGSYWFDLWTHGRKRRTTKVIEDQAAPKGHRRKIRPQKSTQNCNGRALDRVAKQKHRPNRQKLSKKCPENCVFCPPGHFWTIFGHFSTFFEHFVDFPIFWAVQRFARYRPKIKNIIWTSFSEQFRLGSWLVSQGGAQSSRELFEESSCKRCFLVLIDGPDLRESIRRFARIARFSRIVSRSPHPFCADRASGTKKLRIAGLGRFARIARTL